jgi:hypothetical protein
MRTGSRTLSTLAELMGPPFWGAVSWATWASSVWSAPKSASSLVLVAAPSKSTASAAGSVPPLEAAPSSESWPSAVSWGWMRMRVRAQTQVQTQAQTQALAQAATAAAALSMSPLMSSLSRQQSLALVWRGSSTESATAAAAASSPTPTSSVPPSRAPASSGPSVRAEWLLLGGLTMARERVCEARVVGWNLGLFARAHAACGEPSPPAGRRGRSWVFDLVEWDEPRERGRLRGKGGRDRVVGNFALALLRARLRPCALKVEATSGPSRGLWSTEGGGG